MMMVSIQQYQWSDFAARWILTKEILSREHLPSMSQLPSTARTKTPQSWSLTQRLAYLEPPLVFCLDSLQVLFEDHPWTAPDRYIVIQETPMLVAAAIVPSSTASARLLDAAFALSKGVSEYPGSCAACGDSEVIVVWCNEGGSLGFFVFLDWLKFGVRSSNLALNDVSTYTCYTACLFTDLGKEIVLAVIAVVWIHDSFKVRSYFNSEA